MFISAMGFYLYLLIEQRLTDGPGNGARGTGEGGLGHDGQSVVREGEYKVA